MTYRASPRRPTVRAHSPQGGSGLRKTWLSMKGCVQGTDTHCAYHVRRNNLASSFCSETLHFTLFYITKLITILSKTFKQPRNIKSKKDSSFPMAISPSRSNCINSLPCNLPGSSNGCSVGGSIPDQLITWPAVSRPPSPGSAGTHRSLLWSRRASF